MIKNGDTFFDRLLNYSNERTSETEYDTYFARHYSDCRHKDTEADIKGVLGFLVYNIYLSLWVQLFQ